MTNLDQPNNESQPLQQPRNMDRRFLTSLSGFVHQLCDRITGPAPGSADEFSPPSTPTSSLSHKERFYIPISSKAVITVQLQEDYGFSISGNPKFTNIGSVNNYHGLEYTDSFNAFQNSSVQDPGRKCHPGTRLAILSRMQDWFNNITSAERAFWLHGAAKSAISKTIARLGLKPPSSKSPFADELFLEILERQPDQPFLMTFLTLMVARLSIDAFPYGVGSDNFHFDDAILMNLAEFELHRKLRGMRSLFKFKPFIDLHHRSFLDFLKDPSRSGRFYISKDTAQRRYLELITDSVIRFAEKTIDQPNYHESGHFCPQFYRIARAHPPRINLPVTVWQEVLKPLLRLQDKLLALPNFTSTWDLLPCNTCNVFQIMRHLLLHLIIMQGTSRPATSLIEAVELCSDKSDVNKLIVHEDGLASYMYSLLSQLRMVKSKSSVNATTIQFMCFLLHFDYAEIAKRVNSVADAQILMDFIDSLTNDDYFRGQYGPDTGSKLVRLALEIYARIPVLPRSVFSDSDICSGYSWFGHRNKDFEMRCQTALLRRIADHNYVVPLLWRHKSDGNLWVNKSKSLKEWRNTSKPSSVERIRAMLSVAKAIQYLHSIDIVFDRETDLDHIFLDSNLHARIRTLYSTSRSLTETPASFLLYGYEKKWNSYETNIFIFGCLFYEIYFDKRTRLRWECSASTVSDRPSEPTIREEAWQLIQRCCAKDQAARPSMNQVVQEMESWDLS